MYKNLKCEPFISWQISTLISVALPKATDLYTYQMSSKVLVNVIPYAQPSDSMTLFAKKQKSKLLIGASDMIGARYIPLCSNLIGVRYIP